MKKILIFCCVLFVSFSLKAQSDFQPGYVIKNNDDTLKGFIDLRSNEMCSKKCIFKETKTDQPVEYLPGEIKAYRFIDGKYYLTKTVSIDSIEGTFFLEFLVEGKAKLYTLFANNKNYFLLEKENEPIYSFRKKELFYIKGTNIVNEYDKNDIASTNVQGGYIKEDNTYKGALIYYLKEDPKIRQKVSNKELNQRNMVKIAVDYHNYICKDEQCVVYSKKSKTLYSLGFFTGVNYNSIIYNYWYSLNEIIESSSNSGYVSGLNLDIYNPGIFKRWVGTFSLNFSSIEQINSKKYRTIHVLYKNINASVNVNYCYNHYKIQPYIGGGVFFSHSLSSSKVFPETEFYPLYPGKTTLAPDISVGIKYQILDKVYTKVEYLFQPRMFESGQNTNLFTNTQNMFGTLAIMYTF